MDKQMCCRGLSRKAIIPILLSFMIDVVEHSKSAIVITDIDQISARIWYISRTDKDVTIMISNKEISEYTGHISTPAEFCEKYIPVWDNIIQFKVFRYNDILDSFDEVVDIIVKQRKHIDNSNNEQNITVIYSEPLEG